MSFIKRGSLFIAALAFLSGLAIFIPSFASAAPLQSVVYDIPTPPNDIYIQPGYLLPKADGSVWFTSYGNTTIPNYPYGVSRLNVLNPSGTVSWKYATSAYNASFGQLANFGNQTCVTATTGMFAANASDNSVTWLNLNVPGYNAPSGGFAYVTGGLDGSCWYSLGSRGKVGRITPLGVVSYYSMSSINSSNEPLTTGSDGDIWVTQSVAKKISRINPATGQITDYVLPDSTYTPTAITSDNKGGVWFVERLNVSGSNTHKIAHIASDGTVVSYELPEPYVSSMYSNSVASDSSGKAWFAASAGNLGTLGSTTLDGQFSEKDFGQSFRARSLVYSQDNSLWAIFSVPNNGVQKIAKIFLAPTATTVATSGQFQQAPSFNWTSVAAATSYNVFRDGTLLASTQANSFVDNDSSDGAHQYYVTSVSTNGESDPSNTVDIYTDSTSPEISLTPSRQPNANGWYSQGVGVAVTCTDPDAESGAQGSGIQSCSPVSNYYGTEGIHDIEGEAVDRAGNRTTHTLQIKIDTVAPTITFTAESDSWTNGNTVTYQCVDGESTITNTAPIVTNPDGTTTATGTCTDQAGNTTSQTIPVQVDTSVPQTDYSVSSPTLDQETGWSRGPVTVTFQCSDPGGSQASGIASCSDPVTVTAEGTTVVTGTAVDNAGNSSQVNVFVNIDSVAPEITAHVDQTPDENGWYGGDVTVSFTCADATSGVATCPQPVVVTGGGEHTVTGTAEDVAGNTASTSVTVKIDSAPPTIDFTLAPAPNAAGWNTAATTVTFTCEDSNLTSCSDPVTVTAEGITVVTGTATDAAGNSTSVNAFVNIDGTEPELTAAISGTPNAAGWYTQDATVTFTCADATSGVATCPEPVVVSADGTQTVTGTATDAAGNSKTVDVEVKLDKTNPTIAYSVDPIANAQGWNNGDVLVSFTCADATSGVQNCSDSVTVSTEGTVGVTGTVTDNAGNTNEVLVFVSVDKTNPTIASAFTSASTPVNGWYNSDVSVGFTCADALSGVLTCENSHPTAFTADGRYVVNGTATDAADNSATTTATVKLDKTAPVLGVSAWSANPLPLNSTTTVDAPAVDATSGLASAEYFIGDTDPGVGSATSMTLANQWVDADGATTSANLTATLGGGLGEGIYKVTIRTKDTAGNWSIASVNYLVVFNPAGPTNVAVSKKTVPKLANGDVLPGLLSDSQNGQADLAFDVSYANNGTVDSLSNLTLDYANKQGCKKLKPGCTVTSFTASTASPEAIAWLTINGQNSSVGTFQGLGTLAVSTEQGTAQTVNPFKVVATDGNRTTPSVSDTTVLYIYAPGADVATAAPLYQYHLAANGNWAKIQ